MKVILENFGPIRKVEFDLSKDLNVIFGENNIGKSYAITALYIILKHLLAGFESGLAPSRGIRSLLGIRGFGAGFGSDLVGEEEQESALVRVIKVAQAAFRRDAKLPEYDLTEGIRLALQEVFSTVLQSSLTNSFANSFQSISSLQNSLCDAPLRIVVENTHFTLSFRTDSKSLTLDKLDLKRVVIAKRSKQNRTTSEVGHGITVYFKHPTNKADKVEAGSGSITGLEGAARAVQILLRGFQMELLEITRYIYFLPASRSGLYQALSTFGALFAELSKNRSFVPNGLGVSLPAITEPVADYFLRLSTIKPVIEKGEVSAIAQQIEREVLGGEVEFDEQTKKLFFRQQAISQPLDLSFTSSMISEIAPIVAHFKYVLRHETIRFFRESDGGTEERSSFPPSLIFIEEPEAHLHPKVQVKLMEFFARLTKHNVKVVMTSHSNYMFNKLSNLLLTDELEPEKVGSYLMRATPEGSVMDAVAMRAEEEGIADENFVDVAEQLYNERLQAYARTNKPA